MSLRPDDRSGRSRSKSASRDRSTPPRSAVSSRYADPDPSPGAPQASAMPGSFADGPMPSAYEMRSPSHAGAERPAYFQPPSASAGIPYPPDDFTMGDYADFPPHERPGYIPTPEQYGAHRPEDDDHYLAYGGTSSPTQSRQPSYSAGYPPQPQYHAQQPENAAARQYSYTPQPATGRNARSTSYSTTQHQPQPQYQYAQPPEKISYTAKPQTVQQPIQYTQAPQEKRREDLPRKYSDDRGHRDRDPRNARLVDITPGAGDRDQRHGSKSHRLSVDTRGQPGLYAPPSPGLGPHMNRLSVSGNRPDVHGLGMGGGLPPGSPLLEAYHGTYQSLSPMPMAIRPDDDIDDFSLASEPTHSSRSSGGKGNARFDADTDKKKKSIKLYSDQAEDDAKTIAAALNHSKPDTNAICDVLPPLSHDQIMELRKEYKKQVRIQGKGINLSKHLKMKLTGNFGKAAYVNALGRWESEGYWANFWYQSHGSRPELLIESLMGRTNAEIRMIKAEFKDKRYSDSLTRCMEKELKMDKFRTAVLMALEERRQEENDAYPIEYRNKDIETLNKCLRAREGGESIMLEIIVRRSDAHLREVLRAYEKIYQENFARAALKKSNNLVGEVIAHILNGVINKPARDALLLHHAIKDIADKNKDDDLRYELLISRLVRLHWDRMHLARVKNEYRQKYGKELQEDIEDAAKGDFREFMCELAETR